MLLKEGGNNEQEKQRLHERPEWDPTLDGKENISYLQNSNKRLKLNPKEEDLYSPKEKNIATEE